jgi:hypothetical protein
VIVPNELALELHDLELVVVHFRYDLRLPLFVERSELFAEIDRLVVHAASPNDGVIMPIATTAVESTFGDFGRSTACPVRVIPDKRHLGLAG